MRNAGYYRRERRKQLPMERDTICGVYSMSKIITCAATPVLFEEGRFNLEDPLANYLPELKDMKVWAGGTPDAPKLEPLKRPITLAFAQHFPFNEHNYFAQFQTGYYQALK